MKLQLGRELEIPQDWELIEQDDSYHDEGNRYLLFSSKLNLEAIVWYTESDFHGCTLEATYRPDPDLTTQLKFLSQGNQNIERGIKTYHQRRKFYYDNTFNQAEFFDRANELLNNPEKIGKTHLYLKADHTPDIEAELFQIKLDSKWHFTDDELTQLANFPSERLQRSFRTDYFQNGRMFREMTEAQVKIVIDNSPFEDITQHFSNWLNMMQKAREAEQKRLRELDPIAFMDFIFQEAGNNGFVPELNDHNKFLFYYQDANPNQFIQDLKAKMGIQVLSEEQFLQINDAKAFTELQERFSDYRIGFSEADFVVSCGLLMGSIKKSTPPCYKQWQELDKTDDEQTRFCQQCQKHVYHVSTIEEIREHASQRHCIAFEFDWGLDDLEEGFIGDPL